MVEKSNQERVWSTFSLAIGAELREAKTSRGQSGLDHCAQAIAVDDKLKRIIVVAAEADPRTAALMQTDIQATIPDAHVLVARPLTFDVSSAVKKIAVPLGNGEIDIAAAKSFMKRLQGAPPEETRQLLGIKNPDTYLDEVIGHGSKIDLPVLPTILNIIGQASFLPWKEILAVFDDAVSQGKLDFTAILANDTMENDLRTGVCPIPFYEFSAEELRLFTEGTDTTAARSVLQRLGVHQYFFPPADQLTLGVVDQGISDATAIVGATSSAPDFGHPFGESEIVTGDINLLETLEKLKELGYVAEGEHGLEVTPSGTTVRSNVKFKPQESFLTKLLNRVSFSASISPGEFV